MSENTVNEEFEELSRQVRAMDEQELRLMYSSAVIILADKVGRTEMQTHHMLQIASQRAMETILEDEQT